MQLTELLIWLLAALIACTDARTLIVDGRAPQDPQQSLSIWETCSGRGTYLDCLLTAESIPKTAETKFTKYTQLGDYGWVRTIEDKGSDGGDDFHSSQQALKDLELPPLSDRSWMKVQWKHSRATKMFGVLKYPATDAVMANIFNVKYGAIIAVKNESPAKVDNPPPANKLVPLRKWSDVVFLEWAARSRATVGASELRFVLGVNIINEDTEIVLGQAAGGTIDDLGDYNEAQTFEPPHHPALAVLGSPNGYGVAWLLIQHKQALGHKTITSIQAWDTTHDNKDERQYTGGPVTCMIFTIQDRDQNSASNPA